MAKFTREGIVDGRAHLIVDGVVRSSPRFETDSYAGRGATFFDIHQRISPGQVIYFPWLVSSAVDLNPEPLQIGLQMVNGGRAHLSYIPPLLSTPIKLEGIVSGTPRKLADLTTGVHDLSAGIAAPYYSPGKWINGPQNVPAGSSLLANIRDFTPGVGGGDRFHASGKVLEGAFDATAAGYKSMAFRCIFGPDNTIDMRALQHFCGWISMVIDEQGLGLRRAAFATLEMTSYPYRTDRADDHADVACNGGTSDSAWDWTTTLDLPSPSHAFQGWPSPRTSTETYTSAGYYNTLSAPLYAFPGTSGGYQHGWMGFPMGRNQASGGTPQPKFPTTDPASTWAAPANPPGFDQSRITGIQVRFWYEAPAAQNAGPGQTIVITPPVTTWNNIDGAFVDPVFHTDTFIGAGYDSAASAQISVANIGSTEDILRGYIAPKGHDGTL